MKTPFIGAMDSLVQCCKSDLTTTKPWTREWGWLELTHPECLPHYPPSIRPAVITEPVSQHTAEQYPPQSHSKSSSSIETEMRWYIEPNSWSRTIPAQPRLMGTSVSMHGWLWVDNSVRRGSYFSMGMGNWVKGWGFGVLCISSLWVGRQSNLALNILRHMIVTFSG